MFSFSSVTAAAALFVCMYAHVCGTCGAGILDDMVMVLCLHS